MIIYKDRFSNEELFSDTFEVLECGIFFKVIGKLKTHAQEQLDDKLFGGNASAEEPVQSDMGMDLDSEPPKLDIVHNHKLREVHFEKKEYMLYLKKIFKKIKDTMDEETIAAFEKQATTDVKKIIQKKSTTEFKDLKFYCGERLDCDFDNLIVAIMDWEDVDGVERPFMLFLKDGVVEEKV